MKGKESLLKLLKKLSVITLIKLSCTVLLLFLLTMLVIKEPRWLLALIFSIFLFGIYIINGNFDNLKITSTFLYVLEFFALLAFSLFFANYYLSTVYSLVLVDFYLKHKFKTNAVFGACCYIGYAIATVMSPYFLTGEFNILASLAVVFNDFIIFALVFCIVNMLSSIITKNKEISVNLAELAERERKLQEAYNSLKEITKLEERNRIAKRIHDTTGHSLTTIIMQTEVAKLTIDTDPKDAKNKIISANLQAVSALEELRKSVHVLSGTGNNFNLIEALNKTISETMEGTGIIVRSKLPDELNLEENLAFFIDSSLKELLNNGIRHGKSNAFYFEIKVCDNKLFFLLSDNGQGVEKVKLGYGLKTLKQNLEEFGGVLKIISEPGEGFEVNMEIPYKNDEVNND